jgi:signal peptidase II
MVLVVALVGCDHATKVVAKATLGEHPLVLVRGVLDLEYTENRDTAFSLLRSCTSPAKPWLLVILSCFALVAIAAAWWKRRRQASLVEHLAYVLVVGGAIGNAADRLARGYVVDFIYVHCWPVFNVADVAVTVGALALGITLAKRRHALR